MIISISGSPGSGKSTVARSLASVLGYDYISIGSLMRELSAIWHKSLIDLSREAEHDKSIDSFLDNHLKALSNKNNLVVDARLGFHFIQNSVKIFLVANPFVSALRIRNAHRASENLSFPKLFFEVVRRAISEKRRYKKYYDVNLYTLSNYDLTVDTSNFSVDEVLSLLLSFLVDKGVLNDN